MTSSHISRGDTEARGTSALCRLGQYLQSKTQSLLISILRFGCSQASVTFGAVDSRFADLLQGVILFAVLAADFVIRFKIVKKEEA